MKENNFLKGSIAHALIKFAIPLMLSLVLQTLYGAVDLAVVGQFSSTASVSAVATGSHIMHTIYVVIIGFSTGVTILIGQAIGAKDYEEISKIVAGQIKLFSVIVLFITLITYIFAPQIVVFMQTPPEAVEQTISYVHICVLGMVFISAYNGISAIFRGFGNSKAPLLFVLIACVVNIILDIVFVAILNMSATGVALATVFAQIVSVLFSLYYMYKKPFPFKLNKCIFKRINGEKSILKLGSPIALQDVLVSLSFLAITAIINSLGVVESASVGVAEKMFVFLALVPSSFMSSLSAFVAQNIGAGQPDRAKKALGIATSLSFVMGVFICIVTFFWGDLLAQIFASDPLVIAGTHLYLQGVALEHVFITVSFCMLGYFNGLGKTKFVMIQGLSVAFIIRIPLSYYLSQLPNTNLFVIGLAVPIAACVSFVLCIFYYIYLNKKGKKQIKI